MVPPPGQGRAAHPRSREAAREHLQGAGLPLGSQRRLCQRRALPAAFRLRRRQALPGPAARTRPLRRLLHPAAQVVPARPLHRLRRQPLVRGARRDGQRLRRRAGQADHEQVRLGVAQALLHVRRRPGDPVRDRRQLPQARGVRGGLPSARYIQWPALRLLERRARPHSRAGQMAERPGGVADPRDPGGLEALHLYRRRRADRGPAAGGARLRRARARPDALQRVGDDPALPVRLPPVRPGVLRRECRLVEHARQLLLPERDHDRQRRHAHGQPQRRGQDRHADARDRRLRPDDRERLPAGADGEVPEGAEPAAARARPRVPRPRPHGAAAGDLVRDRDDPRRRRLHPTERRRPLQPTR